MFLISSECFYFYFLSTFLILGEHMYMDNILFVMKIVI